MMAGIRSGNTKPELLVRRYLHARGFRYRIAVKSLPGRPDVVLRRRGAVVLVHGCFWHSHPGCPYATKPATRVDFWNAKLAANVARDRRISFELRALGWRVAVVWECGLRKDADSTLTALGAFLLSKEEEIELGMDGMRHALRNE
jgi:DNA mismatch endonuclease (patch repair protein)